MKCNNCGAENLFAGAKFCRNCQQPLSSELSPADQNSNIDATSAPSPKVSIKEPVSKIQIEDEDRIEIGETNPMDYVISKDNKESGDEKVEIVESLTPDPIDNELTLYRDENVKLTVTDGQKAPKLTVESIKDKQHSDYKTTESEQEQGEYRSPFSDAPEQNHVTQKIEIEKHVAESEDAEDSSANSRESVSIETGYLRPSKGVIFLDGNSLRLTGGIKVDIGDDVIINDKTLEVRPRPKDNLWLYIGIGGAALIIIAAILYISGVGRQTSGHLAGIINSNSDNRPLSGQTVRVKELNKTVSTNQAGFFVFENVPSGLYTIQYLKNGEPVTEERITVLKDKTSTLALKEAIPVPIENIPESSKSNHNDGKNAVESKPLSNNGYLKLALNPQNASVYLDGKPLGIGSNTYKVKSGTYAMSVRRQGYADDTRKVTIDAEKTISLKIQLKETTAASKPKTYGELALEQESKGNYKEALKYYDQVLDKNSKDVSALLGKARSSIALNSDDQGIAYYMQASRAAGEKGDFKSQVEALTGVIKARPNTFTAYSARGEVYFNMQKYSDAAEDFAKVIELDSRNLGAYYKLGSCYYKINDYPDALKAFKAAEELNFADPKAHAYMAKTYWAMGDKKNTKKSYEKFKEVSTYSTQLEFKKDPEWQQVISGLGVKE